MTTTTNDIRTVAESFTSPHRANHDYHRNGVAGIGFYARSTIDGLTVAFGDDGHLIGFSWADIAKVAVDIGRPYTIAHRDVDGFLVGLDIKIDERDTDTKRMVAIADPNDPMAVAVFDPELLPSVAFGYNSWRGDRYSADVWAALRP